MTKQLIKHLRLATMVMGMTLATSAMAVEVHKDSKANDLLCVTVNGGTTDALAVLRVEDDGQTQGLLCYLELGQVMPLDNCHVVAGRVYQATTGARNISAVGLIGTGLDEIHGLTQTNFAMQVPSNQTTGQGSAATVSVTEGFSSLFDTQKGSTSTANCQIKQGGVFITPRVYLGGSLPTYTLREFLAFESMLNARKDQAQKFYSNHIL